VNSTTIFDRARATQQEAFDQLLNNGLVKFQGGSMYAITLKGYLAADEYTALMNQPE
jgi:uncharacterized protein with beta-barrel porin domain